MTEAELREHLFNAFKHRAVLYYYFFDEIRKEVGEERATEITKRAIYRRGEDVGRIFAAYGPGDVQGLEMAFLGSLPEAETFLQPEVTRSDAEGVDIKFHRCPLLEGWKEAGIPDDDIAKIADIAAAIDHGIFRSVGFAFDSDTWQPGHEGCCHLHIRPGGK